MALTQYPHHFSSFFNQLPLHNVSNSPRVLLASTLLLVSHIDDEVSQCLVYSLRQAVLPLSFKRLNYRNPSKKPLGQSKRVPMILKDFSSGLTRRFRSFHTDIFTVGDFCSSLRRDYFIKLLLMNQCFHSLKSSLVQGVHRTLFPVTLCALEPSH